VIGVIGKHVNAYIWGHFIWNALIENLEFEYGNEIIPYEIHQFPNKVLKQMVTILLP
jgi:hypothetical protein